MIAGSETAALPTSEADDPIARKMKQLREREQRRKERKAQRAAAEETDESTAPEKPAKPKEIEVGFHVRIKGQQAAGEVLALQGSGKATVAFGHVTTVVDKSRLEIVSHTEYKKLQRKSGSSFPMASTAAESYDTSKKRLNFKQQLDIRGMRAAEAFRPPTNTRSSAGRGLPSCGSMWDNLKHLTYTSALRISSTWENCI